MDWIKIKTHHMLFSELSMTERGMLVSIQSLTAHLERFPTEKEIAMLPGIGRKALATLSDSVRNTGATLSDIIHKVLEDVSELNSNRVSNRERKRLSRSKKPDVTRDIYVTSQEQVDTGHAIREEKRREEKNILSDSEKKSVTRFVKPALGEIENFIGGIPLDGFYSVDPRKEAESFFDFYESKGWVIGKSGMKDWKAAARNWVRNSDKFKGKNNVPKKDLREIWDAI